MPRKALDRQMRKIREDTVEMAELVSNSLKKAMIALENRDEKLAKEVKVGDELVNSLYVYIKRRAIQTIALHQPVAGDLRFISITLDVAKELERVGDYAVDIAKTVSFMEDAFKMDEISEMGRIAREMPIDAIDAFVHNDAEKRQFILEKEDKVNELYASIFPKLVKQTCEKGKCRCALNMVLVGKYLERIADHSVNVANRMMYAVSGKEKYL